MERILVFPLATIRAQFELLQKKGTERMLSKYEYIQCHYRYDILLASKAIIAREVDPKINILKTMSMNMSNTDVLVCVKNRSDKNRDTSTDKP